MLFLPLWQLRSHPSEGPLADHSYQALGNGVMDLAPNCFPFPSPQRNDLYA